MCVLQNHHSLNEIKLFININVSYFLSSSCSSSCLSIKSKWKEFWSREGGGGNLVLFMARGRAIFRGTFSNHCGIMGVFFYNVRHLTELWVPFSGDFSEIPELWPRFSFDLRNYDPKIHQNLRNYGYQFYGQNGTSPSDHRLRYPRFRQILYVNRQKKGRR